MSKTPPIPPEQRTFKGQRPDLEETQIGRRDAKTGLQSDQPGDADVNLEQQGRQANTRQNLTPQWKVQDR
jgi:hypothetical protein